MGRPKKKKEEQKNKPIKSKDINVIREQYPDLFIPTKELNTKTQQGKNEYQRILRGIRTNQIQHFKTIYGLAVLRNELICFLNKGGHGSRNGIKISLSNNTVTKKLLYLYKPISSMNLYNKQAIGANNKFVRYKDENGKLYINMKDYLQSQIKAIAKKVECSQQMVWKHLYKLFEEIYWETHIDT